jgi:NAD kinase
MPNVDAYELIELSPTLHVKNMSVNAPLILNHRDQINLTKFNSNQRCDLIIDGMRVLTVKPHDHIKISLVKSKFKLCFNSGLQEYISKLQKTFIKI